MIFGWHESFSSSSPIRYGTIINPLIYIQYIKTGIWHHYLHTFGNMFAGDVAVTRGGAPLHQQRHLRRMEHSLPSAHERAHSQARAVAITSGTQEIICRSSSTARVRRRWRRTHRRHGLDPDCWTRWRTCFHEDHFGAQRITGLPSSQRPINRNSVDPIPALEWHFSGRCRTMDAGSC